MGCGSSCSCKQEHNKVDLRERFSYDDLCMVPNYSDIGTRASIDTSCYLSNKNGSILKFKSPLISSPMDSVSEFEMAKALGNLGGLGIIHRFMDVDEQAHQVLDLKNLGLTAAAAVGAKESEIPRVRELINHGVDILCIDTAHAHHKITKTAIQNIRDLSDKVHIMAGSVCTPEGTEYLIQCKADSIRLGISNGSLCTTFRMSGHGFPQASAVLECCKVASKYNVPVIADGGIKVPGDVVKAIGLGAEMVMIGSLFAGTDEAPGSLKRVGSWGQESLVKTYRGSASYDSKVARGESGNNVEGAATLVPYKGSVENVFNSIMDGTRSGMSYAGAHNIKELQQKARFVRVTNAGYIEGTPHLLSRQTSKI